MRILVAGGAGFLGSHLVDALLKNGDQVWCLDNLQTGSRSNLGHARGFPGYQFIEGDVREALPELAELEFDQIYNLACPATPKCYQMDPIGTLRTNIIGTLNLLEYCVSQNARLLQASTSRVYGDPLVHPQPESYVGSVSCIGPRSCYDEGKRAAETACYDYRLVHGVDVRIARIFNTYGPRMAIDDGRVIPRFITQALVGDPLTIHGTGSQTRSFCFVSDTVEALMRLMNCETAGIGPVNVGNPTELTVEELAELVVGITDSPSRFIHEDARNDDSRLRRPDISCARKLLGWDPKVAPAVGLADTVSWFRGRMRNVRGISKTLADPHQETVAIIGGGPAGLTAAYSLLKYSNNHHPIVFEASSKVGGIARTEEYKGYRFDIGGHRFFTKVKPVEALWREVLTEGFLKRPRQSRIFYNGKFYAYPLKVFNALSNIGVYESFRILLSYLKWKYRPYSVEDNFQQWVTNRFGSRLFMHFFKSYTEKVWGMPCTDIRADWAAQRIKNLSLRKAVLNAFTGANDTTSLIEEFDYPRLGPGMMWEAFRDAVISKGGEVRMNAEVHRIIRDGHRVKAIEIIQADDPQHATYRIEADQFISSMPITDLILNMVPPAPSAIQEAARKLRYRDFLIVTLIIDGKDLFSDNWIYIHSPDVQVGRIQNFRSWSEAMVPDPTKASIGMEYFCQEGDSLWVKSREELIEQATRELEYLGLVKPGQVVDGTIIRQPKAYPVYDEEYQEALGMIRGWLAEIPNLQVVGRNGMHRYNNQDHSMMTAMLAADNILGGSNDLWAVNVDKEYHEEAVSSEKERNPKVLADAA
ncbi:NAD-dependent epimerase/dehydratase family protein [Altererythrobacter salegens]|uniref:NAD-dependent epimerase/dehydratase family protein n=1 Tax=Croceibacterium salegens TaxID=1737568 RepID=A0A6I4SZS3_9SPHN|nr:NAD-dependent epimerase/dehydratase family protein [Croceibacterium salegens]MXO60730.1 NAD-dependent epimerase/dehydratase family protein [Croceibacterium salegens]